MFQLSFRSVIRSLSVVKQQVSTVLQVRASTLAPKFHLETKGFPRAFSHPKLPSLSFAMHKATQYQKYINSFFPRSSKLYPFRPFKGNIEKNLEKGNSNKCSALQQEKASDHKFLDEN